MSFSHPPQPPFTSADSLNDNKYHILLCASGSVATIKLPLIAESLATKFPNRISIRIVLTRSACHFLQGQSKEQPSLDEIRRIKDVDGVYLDEDEWGGEGAAGGSGSWTRGKSILHIELRRWADIMVVAPLSANTMAKMVVGLCDNLLLSVFRAWDITGDLDPRHEVQSADSAYGIQTRKKVILLAPAMNTAMWRHPVTRQHMNVLERDWNVQQGGWIHVLSPISKQIACGDTGDGAMVEWKEIVRYIEARLGLEA